MVRRSYEESVEGVPQGGPLSPLLANIMLNELDKELARRGHKFVRYADDCMILVRSKRAAERVRESIATFIESRLHLKVNREKTEVAYVGRVKYLGYSFYMMNGQCRLRLHPKSVTKMKAKLKELTSRSKGWGYAKLKDKLNRFINGWMNYFKLADMRNILQSTDEWLRHRIRSHVWKSWKKVGARFKNLVRCGIDRWRAWQWANTRGGYWNTAGSPILCRAMNNESFKATLALWTYMSNCISTKEPPYAERHVRWCERSENESRKKTTSFSSYSITEDSNSRPAPRGSCRPGRLRHQRKNLL